MSPSFRVKFVPPAGLPVKYLHRRTVSGKLTLTGDPTLSTVFDDRLDAVRCMNDLVQVDLIRTQYDPLPFVIVPDKETHYLLLVVDQNDSIHGLSVFKKKDLSAIKAHPTTFARHFRGGVN